MWTKEDREIKHQICLILAKLGASQDVMSVVGSWKETMDDDFILESLMELNANKSIWKNKIAEQKRIDPKNN